MISMSSSTRARKSWKSKVSVNDKPCTNSVYLSSTPHRNAQVLIEPCHTRDSIAVVSHQLPQSSKNEVNELNDWPRLIARQKPSRFTKKKRKEKKERARRIAPHPSSLGQQKTRIATMYQRKHQRKQSAVVQHPKPHLAAILRCQAVSGSDCMRGHLMRNR
jgi:hypothetical protein